MKDKIYNKSENKFNERNFFNFILFYFFAV